MKKLISKAKIYFLTQPQKVSSYFAVALALTLGIFDGALAQTTTDQTTTDPWQSFASLLIGWITGNLGKTLAILTMLISIIIAGFTHSLRVLLYGVVLAVIIGGLVGIARLFFEAGSSAFGKNW